MIEKFVSRIMRKVLESAQQIQGCEELQNIDFNQDFIKAIGVIIANVRESGCFSDEELESFGSLLSKLIENSIDFKRLESSENKTSYNDEISEIFSLEECETFSKERQLSIASFIFAAIKPNQFNSDEYESIFKQFDKETLEWLKNNTPYEEMKESLAYHYCKDDKDE